MTKMVNKRIYVEFSLAIPGMKALFICNLANVVQLSSNFDIENTCSLVHIHMV
jgi:hypothetical protein